MYVETRNRVPAKVETTLSRSGPLEQEFQQEMVWLSDHAGLQSMSLRLPIARPSESRLGAELHPGMQLELELHGEVMKANQYLKMLIELHRAVMLLKEDLKKQLGMSLDLLNSAKRKAAGGRRQKREMKSFCASTYSLTTRSPTGKNNITFHCILLNTIDDQW